MANVTIIRVPSLFAKGALTLSATPPIGIAYLAGSLRAAGHRVCVIDSVGEAITQVYPHPNSPLFVNGLTIPQIIEKIPADSNYLLISLPFSHEWPLAKAVTLAVKKVFPLTVIVGGEHASAVPEFCLNDCPAIDYCVLGEGEETAIELIQALDTGEPIKDVSGVAARCLNGEVLITPKRARKTILDQIPKPAWDIIPIEAYLSGGYSFGVTNGRSMPLIASRGCPYDCTFCSNPQMWGRQWLARDPKEVVAEMEEYIRVYRIQNFDFYDLTAIVRKDWVLEFCNLLLEKKLNISWQLPSGTRSEALDEETTRLLYQSGCRNISYAPESGSPRILKMIKKKVDPDKMLESMRGSVKNGLNLKANIIVGFPGETIKDILLSYKFIVQMALVGVHDVSVWTFSAYPGSEIYKNLQVKNRLPPFSDKYFYSLMSYSDVSQAVSWNESLSNGQLKFLRFFGLLLFYGCSYLFRPFRLFRTLKNITSHQPQSRLEMIFEKALFRHKVAPPALHEVGS